ncbi:universal stress protein [Actinomadura luteofluorescens]
MDPVLDYAFEAAALHGARLRIVHAWQTFATLIEAGYAVDADQIEDDLRKEVVAAYQPVRRTHPGVEVADDIVLEHPVTALANASQSARLLVVGAHDRRWSAPQLGSTCHGVIHHARCPVAVVPAH